ncbi:MAG: hypothetical protein A3B11_00950 [Candidatus Taylorbacteria bacterium RIFCSPLOWO2_01_FULL_44_26]|uniref:Uncharacterized protein n=2 Tax=Parcubacteria group TaxID=1794811 RepID=A0A1G2N888_9BACT|nr:MAG: hypothetical protein A2647_01205 [Candidatus Nomurabacteria bacterium RIFCSPHIGHO2_01_FULL_40_24b]OHA31512.1 MAG: hypothetical protein A3B11_00950 [Candidatus Taylorbacteria bacterium RIFCSPLOWO2_01_FULL_44_26]
MRPVISRRINKIKDLAKGYYLLNKGDLIEKHDELLRIHTIKDSKNDKHPHKNNRVYISRRSIKHFVEERKIQLAKYHPEAEVLLRICFAIEQIPEVITNFDRYEFEPNPEKFFYTKHYPGEPSIRILCERSKNKNKTLEICSIHYKKQQRDK